MKDYYKIFAKMIGVLMVIIGIGYVAIILSYTLPTERIVDNIKISKTIFQKEGSYPNLFLDRSGQLDNFTDASMLLIASYKNNKLSAIENATLNGRPYIVGSKKDRSGQLVDIFSGRAKKVKAFNYARYWHGYNIFLKPALMFTHLGNIRMLVMIINVILLSATVFILSKTGNSRMIVPIAAAYIFLNPVALMLSLQFFSVFFLTFFQLPLLCLLKEKYSKKPEFILYHFLVVGCLTSYFDFLTYPAVTLGMPLAFYIAINFEQIKIPFYKVFGVCVSWSFGYAGMWSAKWVLGSLIVGKNILSNAINTFAYRSGVAEGNHIYGFIEALKSNLTVNRVWMILSLIVLLIAVNRCYKKNVQLVTNIVFVSLMPFLWYFVTANHSRIHSWFTYRELSIFVFCAFTLAAIQFEDKFLSIVSSLKSKYL